MDRLSPPSPWFIAVGASGSDGLTDIKALLGNLPADLDAVILVVLHRQWDRISKLQTVLAAACPFPVVIAANGEQFQSGLVYIGEPGEHITLVERSLGRLVHDPNRLYRNRTVDLLLKSVALHARERTIGVILSGALDDGSRGIAAVHAAGGLTMVLEPLGTLAKGMPENAIGYDGPIDVVGGGAEIAAAIVSAVGAEKLSRQTTERAEHRRS